MKFEIKYFRDKSELAKESVEFESEFKNIFANRELTSKDKDFLKYGISATRCWDVLEYLEGPKGGNDNRRRETLFMYSDLLVKAFNIAINSALLCEGDEGGQPGYSRGSSIIYDLVANNKNSIFYESITPDLENLLQNGRFWGEITRLDPTLGSKPFKAIEDVLINHHSKLTPQYAMTKGFRIFRKGGNPREITLKWQIEGSATGYAGLSSRAIDEYAKFLDRIYSLTDGMGGQLAPELKVLTSSLLKIIDGKDDNGNLLIPSKDLILELPVFKATSEIVTQQPL